MPELVVFVQECLFVGDSRLDVVNPFDIGEIGPKSCVGQRAVLTY